MSSDARNNIIPVDFKKRRAEAQSFDNIQQKAIEDVKRYEEQIRTAVRATLLTFITDATSVLDDLDRYEAGSDLPNFIEFFEECLRYRFEDLSGLQDKIFDIHYKVDQLVEKIAKANLGVLYGFHYE